MNKSDIATLSISFLIAGVVFTLGILFLERFIGLTFAIIVMVSLVIFSTVVVLYELKDVFWSKKK